MGLCAPFHTPATLVELERAGIAILALDGGWIVAYAHEQRGPYSAVTRALEEGQRLLDQLATDQAGERAVGRSTHQPDNVP